MDTESVIKNLQNRGWKTKYFNTKEEASEYLNKAIDNTSVGIGGSKTIDEMGLYESLKLHNKVFWHWKDNREEIREKENTANVYLSSANAISFNGEIVNIDGAGNRIAGQIYGKKRLFIICGINKISGSLNDAILRARNTACVLNAKRLNKKTPCVLDGKCHDCSAKERICRALLIYFEPSIGIDGEVIIINQSLGF